jgi:demethylmenaquinone methyltransferase/2-methoxy-6-polyprenyl-1,4-benzoquinol methylase
MFARIARRYDVANRVLSGGIDIWWRRRLVNHVRSIAPRQLLDLATGSGDVAFALGDRVPSALSITGVDFCQPMLDEAARKLVTAPETVRRKITFQQGDGLALPFADEMYDAVTISFGLRNMADRHKSLSEMRRVLRPGGRAFILEFSQPSKWMRPFYLFYLRTLLPTIAGWMTSDKGAYCYLNETIEAFPDREALSKEILSAGFTDVHSRGMTGGIVALHVAKKD